MDDLRLLRDLGQELEHEPPASLARQRRRLVEGGRPRRWWPFRPTGWLTAGLVAAATVAVVVASTVLFGGTQQTRIGRPSKASDATTVLVIGTDRGQPNRRAESVLLVHLPAGEGAPRLVSVPPDLLVGLPVCARSGAEGLIGAAYEADKGAECLVTAVEKLTAVRVDHRVEVDFGGFAQLVDAVGGVEITLGKPIDHRPSGLRLAAGRQVLDGEKALAYARLLPSGDRAQDSRAKRQYQVMKALLKRAVPVVKDPARLKPVLDAVNRAVTTDLDVEALARLAGRAGERPPVFDTVPNSPSGDVPVSQLKKPEAERLFNELRQPVVTS
jgi:LCP family protein required for cell wall assembly